MNETKICAWCHTEFMRTGKDGGKWGARRFCSYACAAFSRESRRRCHEQPKRCLRCDGEFSRKRYTTGTLEPLQAWKDRKFCSRACALAFGANGKGLPVSAVMKSVRARAVKPRTKCENCGSNVRLQVHHRDGNKDNNATHNLQTLCQSCHSSEHWRTTWRHRRRSIETSMRLRA